MLHLPGLLTALLPAEPDLQGQSVILLLQDLPFLTYLTEVGSLSLFQWIFLIQESNQGHPA